MKAAALLAEWESVQTQDSYQKHHTTEQKKPPFLKKSDFISRIHCLTTLLFVLSSWAVFLTDLQTHTHAPPPLRCAGIQAVRIPNATAAPGDWRLNICCFVEKITTYPRRTGKTWLKPSADPRPRANLALLGTISSAGQHARAVSVAAEPGTTTLALTRRKGPLGTVFTQRPPVKLAQRRVPQPCLPPAAAGTCSRFWG